MEVRVMDEQTYLTFCYFARKVRAMDEQNLPDVFCILCDACFLLATLVFETGFWERGLPKCLVIPLGTCMVYPPLNQNEDASGSRPFTIP